MELVLPAAFVALAAAGRFDPWEGRPYSSMTKEERAAIWARREREILAWDGIELDRAPAEIAADPTPEWVRPGLVVFAGTGTGDQYAWYPRWQDGAPEPPIVLVIHDGGESALFARDMSELLARAMLEHYAQDRANRALFDAHLAIVRPHLCARDLARLDAPAPEACARALDALTAEIPKRTLEAVMRPTKYAEEIIGDAERLARLYERSERFYRELVVDEGREELRAELDAVRANLDRVRAAR